MAIEIEAALCKGCDYCIEICPEQHLKESKKRNNRGYRLPEVDNSKKCTFCKRCELICPEMAIKVEKEVKSNAST